jgi:REP element-mobilizing transposase RayT
VLNQIIIGTLARARQRHEVRVCFFVGLSNHMHILLWVDDAQRLAKFVGYFLAKLAREVASLHPLG